jgi:predicted nucleic acid-binding protein
VLVAIDTSVFVAWTVAAHPFHERTKPWFEAIHAGAFDGVACAHALAELYSVLTKIPMGMSQSEAQLTVANLPNQVRVVPLTVAGYQAAILRCAERGLKSGSVFDALHLVAAERAGADALLTLNPDDFTRLAWAESPRVVVPPDPPSADLLLLR